MKHAFVAIALLCSIPIMSCSDNEEEGPRTLPPLIRLDAIDSGPTSLRFSVTCTQAEQAAYMVLRASDPVSTAAELLASGTALEIGDFSPIDLSGLEEHTDYAIVAAARNGDLVAEVQTLKMSTRAYDAIVEGTRGIGGYYAAELTGGTNGHFSLNISDIVWEDEVAASAGYQFMLSFHSDLAADASCAEPAMGTYVVDPTGSFGKFTLDTRFTKWSATDDEGNGIGNGTVASGTLTLEKGADDTYRATALLMTDADSWCKVTWNGPIAWIDNTAPLITDQHLAAHHARVGYFGTNAVRNPDTDLWRLELYDDLDHATQGMFIQCYTPVADDPLKPVLPSGTFNVAGQDETNAWTFTPGELLFVDRSGTYLIVVSKGQEQDYFCTGGTIVISQQDDEYTIACDLTTTYRTRVSGGYTGPIEVQNEYMPLVEEDLTVHCDRVYQDKLSYYTFGGSYNYNFVLCDTSFSEPNVPDNGGPANIVSIDLYTDVAPVDGEPVIPDGTYTLGGMRAGNIAKGFTYAIHYDQKGRQCQKIVFSEGSLTVSRTDGTYRMTLDCQTNQGYRFLSQFEGELPFGKEKAACARADRNVLRSVPTDSYLPAVEAFPPSGRMDVGGIVYLWGAL